jgi:hypothetical protein
MTRGVGLLVGSLVLLILSGCGMSWLPFQEREPWRREAEVECLKSGAVREGAGIVRIERINGPGICGADFPLKVVAFGGSSRLGFADEPLRPPGSIPGVPPATQPRWPVEPRVPPRAEPRYAPPPARTSPSGAPMSLVPPPSEDREPTYERSPSYAPPPSRYQEPPPYASPSYSPPYRPQPLGTQRPTSAVEPPPPSPSRTYAAPPPAAAPEPVPLRTTPSVSGSVTPVTVTPVATLACPVVSALDQWIATAVQPAAQRWFRQPVVEIKQISAYSCRGMNGQPGARISEHAFGNALDISAFILADGRRVTVKDGWRGAPEEQGFLRDIQGGACQQFNTVLAPGSNVYHYDHIHVDLMRRSGRRGICNPEAVSGEEVAARAAGRRYVRRDSVTGSVEAKRPEPRWSFRPSERRKAAAVDDEDDYPGGPPGED